MLSRLLKKSTASEVVPAFTKKPFFRSEQKAFYGRLRRALPKCYVFPDVELRALMTPISTDTKQRRSEKEYLVGRKVDYAVFDARLSLICVIELKTGGVVDQSPGSNAQLLKGAGIKHFCWDKQKLPTSEQMMRLFGSVVLPGPVKKNDADPATMMAAPNSDFAGPHSEILFARPTSLTPEALDALAPHGHTKAAYPHVWERIRMFCKEPNHLEDYLTSLSMQTRASKRAGFPKEVLHEINEIEQANAAFLTKLPEKPSWNDVFADR
ncbi:DUF2726 domain-containing protein [Massilia sp. PAMC28688]|uniref:DUF2726 domain-containing protein n=1 Tax=Massilia sp. PAMC28688 TaxID=2861283 RepID=UPI001C63A85F|nr:DUF2726 domain-containing protein [Massilia sp. PAMC28688]QYF95160.1 DUF2726 domain-containing protein [Massilia sp. PAMC28688]